MRIEARAFVTERVWEKPYYGVLNLCCYRLSIVHDLDPTAAAVSGDVPLRVVAGSAADKALDGAMLGRAEVRVTLDVPEGGE
jgi:hypothetical protein